jgi:riboflavin synthase
MFTGIIESLGKVKAIHVDGGNKSFVISSPISRELKVDQSISHNGVCLTVEKQSKKEHTVTAIKESLDKSNLGDLKVGDLVNLERSLRPDSLMDGHLVQGHVDTTARCTAIDDEDGSWRFTFEIPSSSGHLLVPKGSVCINGVSLTIASLDESKFSVAIIPYTFDNTTFGQLQAGQHANIEFDVIGKYVMRYMERVK